MFEVEEPLDPYWVYEKYGIDETHPQAWEYVMKEVKSIICFMSGFKNTEMGFKEIHEYEQRSFRKFDTIGGTFGRRNGCESKRNFYSKSRESDAATSCGSSSENELVDRNDKKQI